MRILFLPTNVSGVNYWRMKCFFDKMRNNGDQVAIYGYDNDSQQVGKWEIEFANIPKVRNQIYTLIRAADVVVLQFIHLPLLLATVMMFQEEFGKKMIAEIDDYIVETPAYSPAYKQGFKPGNFGERLILQHLEVSNAVVTSTQYLANMIKRFNKEVYVVPNSIDFNIWDHAKKKNIDNGKVRIGWVGAGNHEADLEIIKEVVPKILDKYKNVEFMFVHGVPDYLKHMGRRVRIVKKWAPIDKYPQHVANLGFDIGLAPLCVNRFNMAKSNLRWLEYSALKIPTVATSIEPYKKSITHGKDGFVCKSVDDWVASLSQLIDNQQLRQTVGDNAYSAVKSKYNLDITAYRYSKVLRCIYESREHTGRNQTVN